MLGHRKQLTLAGFLCVISPVFCREAWLLTVHLLMLLVVASVTGNVNSLLLSLVAISLVTEIVCSYFVTEMETHLLYFFCVSYLFFLPT